ncbi:hypothetical protein CK203_038560 [Vitis vinifera]|uniref:Uncharacterized protein n=1 Tax=Vitis vinifera TaxID=29760 RepID=A0A438I3Y5_VITVI|nr:hypothetical protein CK203_038560 [Vitis vinifera]
MVLDSNPATNNTLNLPGVGCCGVVSTLRAILYQLPSTVFLLFYPKDCLNRGGNFWPSLQIQLEAKPKPLPDVNTHHLIVGLDLCFKIILCGLQGTLGDRLYALCLIPRRLPRHCLFEFRRVANLYFLMISILSTTPIRYAKSN